MEIPTYATRKRPRGRHREAERMTAFFAWCAGVAAVLALPLAGGVVAKVKPSVFGPGTISKPGGSLYRGRFSPDGSEFWFFRKMTPHTEDYRIFRSRRTTAGWGEPEQIGFGPNDVSDLYPAPSPDGKTLVFTSYRAFPGDAKGHANANLWYVEKRGDGWSEPRPMRGASTPANYDSGPWFDPSGTLHFASTTPDWKVTEHREVPAHADLGEAGFSPDTLIDRWRDWSPGRYVWHGIPSPDGRIMLLEVSEVDERGRRGPSDLWLVERRNGSWTEPVKLGPEINTAKDYENFPVFTPDGKTLLFARGFETYYQLPVATLLTSAR
jgi:WD40-like Beta Propeller Repeat